MELFYLNHKAVILCGHGGQVDMDSLPDHTFWDNGSPILTQEDLLMRAIVKGCNQHGPGIIQCTKVVSIAQGLSQKFKVDQAQETPLLENLQGQTNGNPAGNLQVADNGQSDCKTLGDVGPKPTPEPPPSPDSGKPAGPDGPEKAAAKKKLSWIEIELVDEDGEPVEGETYKIKDPSGRIHRGLTDEKGRARVDGINPGSCQIQFPDLDDDSWHPA